MNDEIDSVEDGYLENDNELFCNNHIRQSTPNLYVLAELNHLLMILLFQNTSMLHHIQYFLPSCYIPIKNYNLSVLTECPWVSSPYKHHIFLVKELILNALCKKSDNVREMNCTFSTWNTQSINPTDILTGIPTIPKIITPYDQIIKTTLPHP